MEGLKKNGKKFISFKKAQRIIYSLIFILFFNLILFPMPTLAADAVEEAEGNSFKEEEIIKEVIVEEEEDEQQTNFLPENKDLEVVSTGYYTMTSYNSEVGQCDDSPCITANGFNVCEHGIEDTIAANFLKFGTKVRIPELFGDRIFIVRDRMNKRYTDRVDIWMVNKQDSLSFGVKFAKIELLSN